MLLFFAMPWVSLQSVIVVFPGHTYSKTCVKRPLQIRQTTNDKL